MHLCQANGRTTFIIGVLAPMKNVTGTACVVREFYFHKEWSKPPNPPWSCQNSQNQGLGATGVTIRLGPASFHANFFTYRWIVLFTGEKQRFQDRRKVFKCSAGSRKLTENAFSARFVSNSPEKGWTTSVARLYILVCKPYLWCIDHAQHFWYGAHDQRVTHSCLAWIALFSLSASSCTIENLFLEILMLTKN